MKRLNARLAMVFQLALNDFKSKYAGSVLGALWALAEPLFTVLLYWFVYTVAFGGQAVGGVPYYVWLSVGLAPWLFISDGLKAITLSYRDYSYLIKKTRFDSAILPTVRGVSASLSHLIFLCIALILCAFEGVLLINPLILLLFFAITLLFIIATGRILAICCAKYRDVANGVSVVLNIGFWLTPVFWSVTNLSGRLSGGIMLNPFAIIVEGYRASVFCGNMPTSKQLVYLLLLCGVLWITGSFVQKKYLPEIADCL